MLRLLLAIPAVLISLVWSAFFPAKQAPVPPARSAPAPDPNLPDEESTQDGHELSDANPKLVGFFVVGLFGTIFTAMAVLGVLYTYLYAKTDAIPEVRRSQQRFQHAPVAKTTIAKDWDSIDRLAHQRLEVYGWADRSSDAVRIPITRAVELIAKEGLPARAGQTPYFPPPDQEKLPLMELERNTNALDFDPHSTNATAHYPH